MRPAHQSIPNIRLLFRAFSAPVVQVLFSWGVAPGCLARPLSARTKRHPEYILPNGL